jgi:hypothetical protein
MGDQYTVGQAGAVGPHSRAENISFQQVWNHAARDIDLDQLSAELHSLRAAMRQQAFDVAHDKGLAEIAAAEEAAQQKDGPKTIKHLKAAGKWAFDVATKIGTAVAAKAIQIAIGI